MKVGNTSRVIYKEFVSYIMLHKSIQL